MAVARDDPEQSGTWILLVAENDTAPGGRYRVGLDGATIGRDHDRVDIVLGDALVSRVHARVERGADGYYVENLTSTNTVMLNDREVHRALLGDGDLLRLGGVELRVQVRHD